MSHRLFKEQKNATKNVDAGVLFDPDQCIYISLIKVWEPHVLSHLIRTELFPITRKYFRMHHEKEEGDNKKKKGICVLSYIWFCHYQGIKNSAKGFMVVPAIGCQGGYRANGSLLIIHGILYLFLKITHNTMHFIFIWFILNMCILCRSLIVLSGHYSHCNHGLKPSSSLSTPFYCKFF